MLKVFAVGYNIKTISNINFLDSRVFVSWASNLPCTLTTVSRNFLISWCLFIKQKTVRDDCVCVEGPPVSTVNAMYSISALIVSKHLPC